MTPSDARAIVCRDTLDNGGWKLEDVSVRQPGEGELLIDMVASVSPYTAAITNNTPPTSQRN